MPSTPSIARALRSRASAGFAALVIALVIALGVAPGQSIAAPDAPAVPRDPAPGPGSSVSMELESLGPASLAPGGTLTASVTVTNGTAQPIEEPRLELRTLVPRVTDRTVLEEWAAETTPEAPGPVRADSGAGALPLAPGETRTLTVAVAADALGYSADPSLWGARRIALTLAAPTGPVATLRTFTVWRPEGATAQITQSVLLPVGAQDPGLAATDPQAYAASAQTGPLHDTLTLASRPDVDWLLDPALLDPPALEEPSDSDQGQEQNPQPTTAAPDGGGSSAAAEPTTDGAATSASPETPSGSQDQDDATTGTGRYAPEPTAVHVADTVKAAAADRTILTTPYAQADLVSLDAAGAPTARRTAEQRGREALQTAGITSAGTVQGLAADEASPADAAALQDTGADVVMIPSISLRQDPSTSVTPSSIGLLSSPKARTPVLAPDAVLSEELTAVAASSDVAGTTQRMLAETAVLASEPSVAPRQVLISPTLGADVDVDSTGQVLDTLGGVPWIRQGRTGDLLDAAERGTWASGTEDDSGALYALGTVATDEVHPAVPDGEGGWTFPQDAVRPALLPSAPLTSLEKPLGRLEAARSSMLDTAPADVAELTALSATSRTLRGDEGAATAKDRAAQGARLADAVAGAIQVQPASSYSLIASSSGVPITVSNTLGTPVRVAISVSSDRPVVRLSDEAQVIEVPARDQVEVKVPVEAVANGSVQLTVSLRTVDGDQLGEPHEVPLTVNPSWENWTTVALVIAMGLLVVVGVLRARRHGSDRRAPAVRGPEDAAVLASTGLSAPPGRPAPREDRAPQPDQDLPPDDAPGARPAPEDG